MSSAKALVTQVSDAVDGARSRVDDDGVRHRASGRSHCCLILALRRPAHINETTADAAEAVAFIEELQAFRALPPDEQDAVLAERRAERRARRVPER